MVLKSINIVCWKWEPIEGKPGTKKKQKFTADHVNALYTMLLKHVTIPFRLICCTDDPQGIDPAIEIVPLWNEFRELGGCFSRLVCFKKDFKLFGDRFVSMDLDCIIVSSLNTLLRKTSRLLVWQPDSCDLSRRSVRFCGSYFALTAGSHPEVYDTFDPAGVDKYNLKGSYTGGTDQRQISESAKGAASVGQREGIYNFIPDTAITREIPMGATILFFNGRYMPDDPGLIEAFPWIKEHYPIAATGETVYRQRYQDKKLKTVLRRNQIKRIKNVDFNYILYWWGKWPEENMALGKKYIERAVNGLKRHTPKHNKYSIVLYTDMTADIPRMDNVIVKELDVPACLKWNLKKMFMFSDQVLLRRPCICFDLDVVIVGDLTPLITAAKKGLVQKLLVTCQGAYRPTQIGGSIVAFRPRISLTKMLWKPVEEARKKMEEATGGSERKYYQLKLKNKNVGFWEDLIPGKVLSYKRDCKEGLPVGSSIVRFHGNPRPHEVNDQWVKDNWI